jgi:serine phosphatase RsbU (regulator of sigma subunit)/HAMP domain-containing protein
MEKNQTETPLKRILKNLTRLLERLQKVVGFRLLLTMLLVVLQILTGSYILNHVYNHVRESKLRDIWAILFLEMERNSSQISQKLNQQEAKILATNGSSSLVEISRLGELTLIEGSFLPIKNLKTVGIEDPNLLANWNLLYHQQDSFVLKKIGRKNGRDQAKIFLFSPKFKLSHKSFKETLVYIATRQAYLVYTNSSEVGPSDFIERPLVQYFIRVPIAQSQIDLSSQGLEIYGFFNEIPGTNLTMFAETSKTVVSHPVVEMVSKLSQQIAIVILIGIIILQIVLFYLLKPVSALVGLAQDISQGHFQVRSKYKGFGEVNLLTQSFHDMARNLMSRDQRIQDLMKDQIEKIRLANELSVAKEIQDSLLPKEAISPDSGLLIETSYIPASEVAGDWFHYSYDPKTQKTLIAVVDISGHGTGASMYTAITAAIFSEFIRAYFSERVKEEYFFEALNRNIMDFGRGKWSATGQIFVYDRKESKMIAINAGHTPPMIRIVGEDYRQQSMPSTVLGMPENLQFNRKEWAFPTGSYLVSYTDGLSDRNDPKGKPLGIPGVRKILRTLPEGPPSEVVKHIKDRIEQYSAGEEPKDDTCIVVVKAA